MPEEVGKQQETCRIRRLFLAAFFLNLILAGLKSVLAMKSESLALLAGTIDSITDSVASLAVYVGILLSTRSTKTFPLGLYKLENFLSIAIAMFIFLAGYEVARQVLLTRETVPTISRNTLLLLVAATAAIFIFGRYAAAVGRQTGSPALKAEGKHRQADVFANILVLFAVMLNYLGLRQSFFGLSIDQWAALLVLLFVVYTGWDLLSDAMRVLLDASIDNETLTKIRDILVQEPTVVEVRSLIGRNAGRFLFIQARVVLRTKDLEKAHAVSEHLERQIMQTIPHVQQVIIHYEPILPERLCIAFPLKDKLGTLSQHFGSAPYFALIYYDLQADKVSKREVLSNPYQELERGKGLRVAEWLVSQNVDQVASQKTLKQKGPEYVLSNAGVTITQTDADTVGQISLSQLVGKV